jgi:hypothetical protein
MAKSRQGRQNKAGQKDGQYRKESKEERKARLERQAKAREVRGICLLDPDSRFHYLTF